ncbi:MAG: hypothetical protein QMA99_09945, partial [Flavobacterium sp.]
ITVFTKARQVTHPFHVRNIPLEAPREIRITLKWKALDREIGAITQAKFHKNTFLTKNFPGQSKKLRRK